MNIQALARTAARIGFSLAGQESAGGVLKKVTIRMGGSAEYDPETGTQATTWTYTATDIDALIYTTRETTVIAQDSPTMLTSSAGSVMGQPKMTNDVAMVRGEQLPAGATIEVEDEIEIQGVTYKILGVEPDPARAEWTLRY